MLEVVASVCILGGAVLALIAAIGLNRFDSVFPRLHAATKPATLGLALVLIGAAILAADRGDVAKLLVVVALQFVTAPVGAHLLGRATYHLLSPPALVDELAEVELGGARRPDESDDQSESG
jgi:multicomponent Na+:H+ antiporter subunit G